MHRLYAPIRPSFRFAWVWMVLSMPGLALAQDWATIDLGTTSTIRDIEASSFSDVYAVGDNGTLLLSNFDKTVWTPLNGNTTADLYSVRRPTSSQIWISGAGGVVRLKLHNTGWESVNVPTSERVVMYSRGSGCQNALGSSGSIHFTCDAADTWSPKVSGTSVSLNHGAGFTTNTSWVVGDNGTILVSTDGSDTWTPQVSGVTEDLNYFLEAGGGYKIVVGDNGTILRSNDGGTTWTQVSIPTNADLYSVSYSGANANFLLAAGEAGTVLKSVDIGATWCQLDPGTNEDLRAVRMLNNTQYIVAGTNGIMRRTTNGGGPCSVPTSVDLPAGATRFSLRGPYPQPTDGAGRFHLRLESAQSVEARLFDVRGRAVSTVFDGRLAAGVDRTLSVDTSDLPAGVYYLRVSGESFEATRKLTVVR